MTETLIFLRQFYFKIRARKMNMKKFLLILSLWILALPLTAKSFYIIKIEDEKAYLDVTRKDIISSKLFSVYSKPEKVTHPVTGKEIELTKKLGTLVLMEVKDDYSVASIPENMKDKVEVGQKVEFFSTEAYETASLAFGEEVVQEMGKRRNSLSFGGNYHFIDEKDQFFGLELHYKYNFLLTYLYSIQIGMGYAYGEYNDTRPKFIYAHPVLEWRLGSYVSLLTGGRVGVKKEGIGYGVEGGFRIGKPYRTNVVFAGSTVQDFGESVYMEINGRVEDSWLSLTIQVDNYPVSLDKETFRLRFGARTPTGDRTSVYGGLILSGRNTDEVGFGADLGMEFKF